MTQPDETVTGPPDDYTGQLKQAAHEALSMTREMGTSTIDAAYWEQRAVTAEAEVGRLNTEADIARRAVNVTNGLWQSSEKECAELRAEVERLVGIVAARNDKLGKQRAEIERLKAVVARLEDEIDRMLAGEPRS